MRTPEKRIVAAVPAPAIVAVMTAPQTLTRTPRSVHHSLVATAAVFHAAEGRALRKPRATLADVRDAKLLSSEQRIALLGEIEAR